ncbi:phosphatase PAP2 family protein [Dermatophilaceae bacterium Sec6.4]|nr:phosphatase PAP2 family protein [Actinomycetota bacterium]
MAIRPTGLVTTMPEVGHRAILPSALRLYRAPVWWYEVALIVVFDLLYERLRNLVPDHEIIAVDRGLRVLHLTQVMHVNFELSVNHFFAAHDALAQFANYYYSFLNIPVTAGILIWLYVARKRYYRSIRSILAMTTLFGLAGFYLLPMAPPRLLGVGFIDTLVQFGTPGSWGDASVASFSNQFAAMPSLHCAWALWAGLTVHHLAKNKIVRVVALIYPMITFIVVIGTANHFALDGIAGAAIVALAFGIHRSMHGRGAYEPAPLLPDYC